MAAAVGVVVAVLLILIPLIVAGRLTLPALSVHDPDADSFVPFVLRTIGAEQLAMPERLSVPEKATVTSVLYQPFEPGAGDAAADATGFPLSIFVDGETKFAVLPAASVTTIVPLMFSPSAVKRSGL